MSNILQVEVTIVGTRPLFWHVFGPDAIPSDKSARTERTGAAGNDPEEWRKTVTFTKERQLYVDPSYIFGTIRDGAKHTKKGRGSIQASVAATLQVTDERVLVDRFMPEGEPERDSELPVYLDVRGVKNPATKGRNVRYRIAASKGWRMTFHLVWDRTIVSQAEMNGALIDAGKLSGVGDARSIGFGRFDVESFTVTD